MLNTKRMLTGSLVFMWLLSFNTDGIVDIKTKLLKKKSMLSHIVKEKTLNIEAIKNTGDNSDV